MKSFAIIACAALAGCAIPPRGPVVQHTVEHFAGREDGLVSREVWRDDAFSRGYYLFADPSLQTINAWHTNQSALGGCSHFSAGAVAITVSSNLVPAIGAAGTAVGNIVGAAAKTALK